MFLENVLSPPILCFLLGLFAVLCKSSLEFPAAISKFLSLYLLFCIGFNGGVQLNMSGAAYQDLSLLAAAILISALIPVILFFTLKKKFGIPNTAAIGATYGSVSVGTFLAAADFLEKQNAEYSGFLVAAIALMASPSLVVGIFLYRIYYKSPDKSHKAQKSWGSVFREACLNDAVFILLGSLAVGLITGKAGWNKLHVFSQGIFQGMLSLFLLDMGLLAARRVQELQRGDAFAIVIGIIAPIFNAILGMSICAFVGATQADALMFSTLCASASYIASPAVMRHAIPESYPSLYVSMSLVITFPWNILFGIPLYAFLIERIWTLCGII